MNRPLRALFMAAVLLAAANFAHAQIGELAAQSLVRKSGLWEQMSDVGPQIEAGMRLASTQAGMALAESEMTRIERVIQDTYAPDRLRSVSTKVIAAKMQVQHVDALEGWFDSPSGQAITRAEEAAIAGRDPSTVLMEGADLLKAMPPERRELLEELLTATHAADALVQITISSAIAVRVGMASALPAVPTPSGVEMGAMLEAQRPQMLRAFRAMTLASFAHTYVEIPSQQLRQYVGFVRTPAGTAFNDVVFEALEAALTDAAAEMGRRLLGTLDGSNT